MAVYRVESRAFARARNSAGLVKRLRPAREIRAMPVISVNGLTMRYKKGSRLVFFFFFLFPGEKYHGKCSNTIDSENCSFG